MQYVIRINVIVQHSKSSDKKHKQSTPIPIIVLICQNGQKSLFEPLQNNNDDDFKALYPEAEALKDTCSGQGKTPVFYCRTSKSKHLSLSGPLSFLSTKAASLFHPVARGDDLSIRLQFDTKEALAFDPVS